MIRYFIHFTYSMDGKMSSGNTELPVHFEINQISKIRKIEEMIEKESGCTNVVVTNYIRLGGG